MKLLPIREKITKVWSSFLRSKRKQYFAAAILDFLLISIILLNGLSGAKRIVNPLISPLMPLRPITENKNSKEVFGFAPYWNIDKLSNVDFKTLTTFAYFGIAVNPDGNLDKDSVGFETFKSDKATQLFKKAHLSGTRVVLTLTQMDNSSIRQLLDNNTSQDKTIEQA